MYDIKLCVNEYMRTVPGNNAGAGLSISAYGANAAATATSATFCSLPTCFASWATAFTRKHRTPNYADALFPAISTIMWSGTPEGQRKAPDRRGRKTQNWRGTLRNVPRPDMSIMWRFLFPPSPNRTPTARTHFNVVECCGCLMDFCGVLRIRMALDFSLPPKPCKCS